MKTDMGDKIPARMSQIMAECDFPGKMITIIEEILLTLSVNSPFKNPFIYPVTDEGIRVEWEHGNWEISALFDSDQRVFLHALNHETDEENFRSLKVGPSTVGEIVGFSELCL